MHVCWFATRMLNKTELEIRLVCIKLEIILVLNKTANALRLTA